MAKSIISCDSSRWIPSFHPFERAPSGAQKNRQDFMPCMFFIIFYQRALEVAACQWHAFSNDRSEAKSEPRSGPTRTRTKKTDRTICPICFFVSVR